MTELRNIYTFKIMTNETVRWLDLIFNILNIMSSFTLALIDVFTDTNLLVQHFTDLGYDLLFSSSVSTTKNATLTLINLTEPELQKIPLSPWVAWDQTGDAEVIAKAYKAGARAVFPKETAIHIIVSSIQPMMKELQKGNSTPDQGRQYTYHRGDLIFWESNSVIHVAEGVLATTMILQDGAETLLGLSGPGQIVVSHPADNCHIRIVAHTDAKVRIEPWEMAVLQPGFPKKLRDRLQQMEGWSAMQARSSLSERVLGALGLLAGQFGCVEPQGILVDVRITHAQLALAVGVPRTSITRVIGELRDTGKIRVVSVDGQDRFYLCDKTIATNYHCGRKLLRDALK